MLIDSSSPSPALLPAGLADVLPPEAEAEAALLASLMQKFASHGYERVAPPLLEFEDSLLAEAGGAVADQMFRLMDPDSHRMMGLRPDITPQIARIAGSRLGAEQRPLRLCYAGPCLRTRAVGAEIARQVSQAGIELIGPDLPQADAEIVLVAAAAFEELEVPEVSFDLTMPRLVPALLDEAGIAGPQRHALLHALDRKDAAAVAEHGGTLAPVLTRLLLAAGPMARALDELAASDLPPQAAALAARLAASARAIAAAAPAIKLTVDPVEFRGFAYHSGVSLTAYAAGTAAELGRGGRYLAGSEPATGITLYPAAMAQVAPAAIGRRRVYVPFGQAAPSLRAAGFATIAGLEPVADGEAEARRLRCSHIVRGGVAVALAPETKSTET